MKKILLALFLLLTAVSNAFAVNMVQKEDVLKRNMIYSGLPDFPPFSYYTEVRSAYILNGAFLKPLREAFKSYSFTPTPYKITEDEIKNPKLLLLSARSGEFQIFIGAMTDTKLFTGLEFVYPAVISDPIHIITTPDGQDAIKSFNDLLKLKGVVSKEEYLSDFVVRKIQSYNVEFVDTSYDAYEKLFTGQVDYMIGSAFFNRFKSSHYGLHRYMVYSKNPIFKTPIFIAFSKITPVLEEYVKAFSEEFSKPSFGRAVKEEIIRIIEEEEANNDGVVPPAFVKEIFEEKSEEETPKNAEEAAEAQDDEQGKSSARIIEKEKVEKSLDEVLEGL